MIYFIRAVGTPYVKIGVVRHGLEDRLETLQIGCPHQLIVEATCSGLFSEERAFHACFRGSRVRGEWYELDAATVATVASLGPTALVKPARPAPRLTPAELGAALRIADQARRTAERLARLSPEVAEALRTDPSAKACGCCGDLLANSYGGNRWSIHHYKSYTSDSAGYDSSLSLCSRKCAEAEAASLNKSEPGYTVMVPNRERLTAAPR